MAVSKIKAIKSTLDKAIDYIINPEKTEGGTLVSSFGCGVGSAAVEMQMTASQGRQQGNRIGYHLIQSFSPEDDLTPEKAHELGKEFADKVLKGKYEYVISTHVDEGHIHNHIIFNATSYYSKNKYHYGANEKTRIRGINDRICRANNLSVIEKPSGVRGKNKYGYIQSKAGKSWIDKLRKSIDDSISKASNFNEFLQFMQLEGYEIKRGKHIAFRARAEGQESFTRAKTIGEAYTEDAIRDRIENPKRIRNLIIDISQNIKAQESRSYKRVLEMTNINTLVKTMNFLITHDIQNTDNFKEYYLTVNTEYESMRDGMKQCENIIIEMSERIKFMQNYKKYYNTYKAASRASKNSEFYREHENEIILFYAAQKYFKQRNENPYDTKISDLYSERNELKLQKSKLEKKYRNVKSQLNELRTVQKNVEGSLNIKLMEKEIQQHKDKSHDTAR